LGLGALLRWRSLTPLAGLIVEEKSIDQDACEDHGGEAQEQEPIAASVLRPGFADLRFLSGRVEALQVFLIAVQKRFFVDADGLGVFPDEIPRVDGRREPVEVLVFYGHDVDHADPGGLEDVFRGEALGLRMVLRSWTDSCGCSGVLLSSAGNSLFSVMALGPPPRSEERLALIFRACNLKDAVG
jgi:hypothetical protein